LNIEIVYIQKTPTNYIPDDDNEITTTTSRIIVYDIIDYLMDLGIDDDDDDDVVMNVN